MGTTSAAQPVTLTNYGAVVLNIIGIGFTGADPSDFAETNTCGSSVFPGASCTINVRFKPTGINERTASIFITDHAPGSPSKVSLVGEGTVVELNPPSLGFVIYPPPHPGSVRTLTSTLTNTGSTTLAITGIKITGESFSGNPFSGTSNCGSVAAGKSCTISVTFAPKWTGPSYGVGSISDNGGGSPQQLPLSGFCFIEHAPGPCGR